ncbi:MAG TPA: hypothetical protein VL979_04265 [Solirubrobacteraceae bacterium]|nr:hypothetical protein [Solirubrobacteraceae bacterium]
MSSNPDGERRGAGAGGARGGGARQHAAGGRGAAVAPEQAGEGRYGPLLTEPRRKGDGRALTLYRHAPSTPETQAADGGRGRGAAGGREGARP